MVEIGYSLSSEAHGPREMVRWAAAAEQAGFTTAMVSDHFHPWISRQGQSPFVWSVLGGIAQATERMRIGTGVTCPTIRIHPAIIAQAAATAAAMLPGRFFLGVGTGEALNEHVLGDHWPEAVIRIEMLEEAVEVMRLLWQGGTRSHYGEYYVVENARLFTLPDEPPPVLVSAFGPMALDAAARIGDGYIGTSPDAELVKGFTTRRGKASRASPRCGSRGRRTRPRRGARCSSCGPPTACPGSSARFCRRSSISGRPLRCSARTRWAPFRFYQREVFPKLGGRFAGARKGANASLLERCGLTATRSASPHASARRCASAHRR